MSRVALYRHFDASGRLLYVGISLDALRRLGQHRQHAHWYSAIRRVEVEWFESRELAEAAERQAIWTEKPAHNVMRYGSRIEKPAQNCDPVWFVLHPVSGRIDGWYVGATARQDATEVCEFLRNEFRDEIFVVLSRARPSIFFLKDSQVLRVSNADLWAKANTGDKERIIKSVALMLDIPAEAVEQAPSLGSTGASA